MFIEPNILINRYQNIYVPNWDTNLNGFKIAVISDLHIGSKYVNLKKVSKIIDKVNRQKPDLVIIPGDLDANAIHTSNIPQDKLAEELNRLSAPCGIFAVLGNHDYEPNCVIQNLLAKTNIQLLQNENKYITANHQKIKIAGFKDLWHADINPQKIVGTVTEPTIVIMHNPDTFPDVPQNISLAISGHTHGGEIYIPLLGSPFVPSIYHQRYRKGYIVEHNKHLYVSSGIATLSHFRFCNPPEIVFITIYKQTPATKIENKNNNKGLNKNYIPYYRKIFNLK